MKGPLRDPSVEKKSKGPSEGLKVAYRLLASQSRSTREVEDRLGQKGYSNDVIKEVVKELTRLNYMDDRKYALARAFYLAESKFFGPVRISYELLKRGIPKAYVDEAVDLVKEELGEKPLAKKAMNKYMRTHKVDPSELRSQRRIVYYLKRRGFSEEVILPLIREVRSPFKKRDFEDAQW